MKKLLYVFWALAASGALSACSGNPEGLPDSFSASGSVFEQSATETRGHTEEAATETAERSYETAETNQLDGYTEEALPQTAYVDENGLITQEGMERIAVIAEEQNTPSSADYTGLFDFDRDGVPEVYFVRHNAGQGLMPVDVFSLDGAEMGSFEGYCRDGFCRLSYGEDSENCVYVHNSYEHFKHDSVYRLTIENGRIDSEQYLLSSGAAGDNFPLLNFSYKIDGEETSEEDYFTAYNRWLWDSADYMTREANEVSICAADSQRTPSDMSGMSKWAAELYNEYVSGKNTIREQLGESTEGNDCAFTVPMAYAFDDYDGDGCYEAFVVKDFHGETYFLKDGKLTEFDKYTFGGAIDCTRYGGLFMINGFGNSNTCAIYGVSEGAPYEHETSYCGMFIRTSPSLGFNIVYKENGIFALYRSAYNSVVEGGSHTWTPYPFSPNETDNSWGELPSVPVTREYFVDRADVQAAFDKIEAEGGEITTAFLRGERYLNINYTVAVIINDAPVYIHENHYKTFIIQNGIIQIDEGRGIYYASITGE